MKENPSFVKDFKSEEAALNAVHILVAAKKNGYSNLEFIKLPFFMSLFSESFLNRVNAANNTNFLIEVRLKNIARDFRITKKEKLNEKWHFAKDYFDGLKRKCERV